MRLIFLLVLLTVNLACAYGQITGVQQKALNNYVDYANQSAKEISLITESLKRYYSSLRQTRSWSTQRYACPVQPETYYYENALKTGKSLAVQSLTTYLNDLKAAADSLDRKCKELDTYYKLEDFKKDNHAQGEVLVTKFPALLKSYRTKQRLLQSELETVFAKLAKTQNQTSYGKADIAMRKQIAEAQKVLDQWDLNFYESVHAGWPDQSVFESIIQTDAAIKSLAKQKTELKYPASSMWSSFQESLISVQQEKKRGIDEYNFDAKKNDKHSNDVYLNLINYFNGTLVSNYNTFIEFSERDRYFGLKYIQYFPSFEIRESKKEIQQQQKSFEDIQIPALEIQTHTIPIDKTAHTALTNYIDFINESWRQVRYLSSVLASFNSSANYYRTIDSFDKRAPMHFDFQNFTVPKSQYQKTIAESSSLPVGVSKSLNAQCEVLFQILQEMELRASEIDEMVETKQYEKDHLSQIYRNLEREKVLIDIWDEKKESLYNNLLSVYQSYPIANKTNSWHISGTALASLVELSHQILFTTKKYYQGDTTIRINTQKLDGALRDVLMKEYDNMKGIEKLGRNNGNCPYTPYEDIPATARRFSEKIQKIKPVAGEKRADAYEKLLYDYNEIVDDYNDFCTLSKDVLLLKSILQPELFYLTHPNEDTNQQPQKAKEQAVVKNQEQLKKENTSKADRVSVVHDTVYVRERDTVYIREDDGELRSMEGYATNNMVLLLDVSGSMNSKDKLPLLKQTVYNIMTMMREEDELSIVTFSENAKVVLKAVSFKQEDKIRTSVEKLKSSGRTNASSGLQAAYKLADLNYIRGGNNRIILATDGEFAITDDIKKLVKSWAEKDIQLSIFYFGKKVSGNSLESLTNLGNGNFSAIQAENIEFRLIREAKAKRKK